MPLCPLQVHIESTYGALPPLANTSLVYVGKFSLYFLYVRGSNHSNRFFPYPCRTSCFEYSIAASLFSGKFIFLASYKIFLIFVAKFYDQMREESNRTTSKLMTVFPCLFSLNLIEVLCGILLLENCLELCYLNCFVYWL